MNYPAASCGVSEKPELLPMQLCILRLRSLISNVPPNARFITMLPYRAHEIPVAPKFSSPKLFLHLRAACENLPCRNALDDLHDFLRTIHRHRLDQEVNMVLIGAYLNECHLIPFTDFQTCLFQLLLHRRRKHHSPVFGRAYDVIQKH